MSLDVAEIDGNVIVREFGGRSSGAYDLTGTEQLVRRLTRDLYTTETSLVRQQVSTFAGIADAPEWTDVLRSTATHGWLLHRALSEQGFGDPGRRFEIINRLPDRYVPIEFVYDRGAPAEGAVIDPVCLEALRRGDDDCGRCHPFADLTDQERDENPRICPFGFWSLGKIIERHDADEQGRLSGSAASTDEIHSLGRLGSVLTGWSGRLRPEDAEALPRVLRRDGRLVTTVDSWDDWKAELSNEPGILLALPHHEEENGIGTLEIGSTSRLSLARALDLYVRTPAGEPGPILILLGCETDAAGELGHPSFARAFNAHASIVIGTLSKVLGRHAVPFAQRLVDALVDAQDRGGDVGTVLRDVRREMFADGYLMALGVIALGDGDWQLTGEEVA